MILPPNDKRRGGVVKMIADRIKLPKGELKNQMNVQNEPEAEVDYDRGYEACCDEIVSAVKMGSGSDLKRALKNFLNMYMDEKESMDD